MHLCYTQNTDSRQLCSIATLTEQLETLDEAFKLSVRQLVAQPNFCFNSTEHYRSVGKLKLIFFLSFSVH